MASIDFIYQNEYQKEISFPLGGIGSGCVGLSGDGRLIDWELHSRPNKQSVNGFTHFAIKAQQGNHVLGARVLQSDTRKDFMGSNRQAAHSWGYGHGIDRNTMAGFVHFRNVTFHGNFPVAEVEYGDPDFPARMRLTAFNPFIPSNVFDSSLPAAFFEWEIQNTSTQEITYTIAFSCRNPLLGRTANHKANGKGYTGVRFSNSNLKHNADAGTALIATDCENTAIQEYWYRGEWFDALTTFWNDFSSPCPLKERHYARGNRGEGEMATLSSSITIPAGGTGRICFLLTWHFQLMEKYWGKSTFGRRYRWKQYYAKSFCDAAAVADYCFANWARLKEETFLFRDTLFQSEVPECVLDAIQGNLAILKSSTCLRLQDGAFYTFEGSNADSGSCEGSCTHVWNYAYALAFLFPERERSMRELEYSSSLKKSGAVNFRLMLPLRSKHLFRGVCADGQMGGLLKFYREWMLCGDENWRKKYWPAVQRSLAFAWSEKNPYQWDPQRKGVFTGQQHHTLDMELFGPNSWITGYYLAALRAAQELARADGDEAAAREYSQIFQKGSAYVERELFNGRHYIQQINLKDPSVLKQFGKEKVYWNTETQEMKYQYAEGCEIDQVIAQWHANLLGLGSVFQPAHLHQALEEIYRQNFKQMRSFNNPCRVYAADGEAGLVICSWEGGAPAIPLPYAQETMCGFEYAAACLMLQEGMERQALEIVSAIRARYDGQKRNPWAEIECGGSYVRSLASYSLLLAYSGLIFDLPHQRMGFRPLKPGSYFFALDGCWGSVHYCREEMKIQIRYGTIRLKQIAAPFEAVSLTVNSNPVPFTTHGRELLLQQERTIAAGDAICIKFSVNV